MGGCGRLNAHPRSAPTGTPSNRGRCSSDGSRAAAPNAEDTAPTTAANAVLSSITHRTGAAATTATDGDYNPTNNDRSGHPDAPAAARVDSAALTPSVASATRALRPPGGRNRRNRVSSIRTSRATARCDISGRVTSRCRALRHFASRHSDASPPPARASAGSATAASDCVTTLCVASHSATSALVTRTASTTVTASAAAAAATDSTASADAASTSDAPTTAPSRAASTVSRVPTTAAALRRNNTARCNASGKHNGGTTATTAATTGGNGPAGTRCATAPDAAETAVAAINRNHAYPRPSRRRITAAVATTARPSTANGHTRAIRSPYPARAARSANWLYDKANAKPAIAYVAPAPTDRASPTTPPPRRCDHTSRM